MRMRWGWSACVHSLTHSLTHSQALTQLLDAMDDASHLVISFGSGKAIDVDASAEAKTRLENALRTVTDAGSPTSVDAARKLISALDVTA